jgi:hypothetical protein
LAQVGLLRHQGNLNVRSLGRRLYIERLSATPPWIDYRDLEAFLMGFEAGESWAGHNGSGRTDRQFADASWLTPENVTETNITLQIMT